MHRRGGRKLRDEGLNETLFGTLGDARKTLEEWQENYNWRRPHSALGNLTLGPCDQCQRFKPKRRAKRPSLPMNLR
ncbi:integrase core domain-containing protein [Roseovarius sp. S4756]|uniref:integrase core domain-containing protein n=1 Tax=Roseovarius maritimus TaxID=3342637 RepID=UPI00372B8A36